VVEGVDSGYQMAKGKAAESMEVVKRGALALTVGCAGHSDTRQEGVEPAVTTTSMGGSAEMLRHLQDKAQSHLQHSYRGLHEKAQAQLHSTMQAVNERLDTAQSGKRLLDDGGDSIIDVLLAKSASVDAAAHDALLVRQVRSTAAAYAESTTTLHFAARELVSAAAQTECIILAETHSSRAKIYEQVAFVLGDPALAPAMIGPEWDAIAILQAREKGKAVMALVAEGVESSCQSVKGKAANGVDALKTWATTTDKSTEFESTRIIRNPCV